jgi:hypothetical protein
VLVDPCSQNIPIWANWRAILKDFRAEPQIYLLWDNCAKENKYIDELESHVVLDTLEAVAERINL